MRTLTPVQIEVLGAHVQHSYWTMRITFPEGDSLRIAGSAIVINGEQFEGGIISTSGLRASLGNSVDRIDVRVSNTDWRWTRLARQPRTFLTRAIIGRSVRTSQSASWTSLTLLTGIVASVVSDEREATLQCISDLYAAPSVGAIRTIARPCQWKYKDPRTCGYTGPEPTCNKIFESPDGCLGRNNQHRYGGFTYDTGKDSLSIPPPDPTGNPDPGGGGIGGDGSIYHQYNNDYILSY